MDENQQSEGYTPGKGAAPRSSKGGLTGIIIVIILIALAVGAYFYFVDSNPLGNLMGGSPVAVVNGEEITQSEFDDRVSQLALVYEAQGVDLEAQPELRTQVEQQVLDSLINETLVLQYAQEQGISVSEEEIQNNIDNLQGQFENDDAFQAALAQQGLAMSDVHELVERQLTFEKVQTAYTESQGTTVTEEEVQAAYAQLSAQSTTTAPLAEVRGQIEEEILRQKASALLATLVQELREGATIEITGEGESGADVEGNTEVEVEEIEEES